jgi:hypothetical protein
VCIGSPEKTNAGVAQMRGQRQTLRARGAYDRHSSSAMAISARLYQLLLSQRETG